MSRMVLCHISNAIGARFAYSEAMRRLGRSHNSGRRRGNPQASARDEHRSARSELLELIQELRDTQPVPLMRPLFAGLEVARMTLRRIVDGPVAAGMLVRRRGTGTLVPRPTLDCASGLTFAEDRRLRDLRSSGRTLDSVGRAIGPHVSREQNAVYALTLQRYGTVPHGAERVIEATTNNEDDSPATGVPLHSPAFFLERTSQKRGGRIIQYVARAYRGDRVRVLGEVIAGRGRRASTSTVLRTVSSLSASAGAVRRASR